MSNPMFPLTNKYSNIKTCNETIIFSKSLTNDVAPLQHKCWRERDKWDNHNLLHRFKIMNGALFNKDVILTGLIKHVQPHFLLPIKYERDKEGNTHFLASKCWEAMRAIIGGNFTVPFPELGLQIELEIHINYRNLLELPISPACVIQSVFKNRMVTGKDSCLSLDASRFNSDVSENEVDVYFPLWVPHFQRMLVRLMQTKHCLRQLNLSHNGISSLMEFTKIHSLNLQFLDLSHNQISWSDLVPIQSNKVKELWLEGNPLCSNVSLAEYLSRVTTLYPNLERLDGVKLVMLDELERGMFLLKNCLMDVSCHQIVDQFLHHYMSWFCRADGRPAMVHMYLPTASISISSNLKTHIMDNYVSFFPDLSRNILKITNYARAMENFNSGIDQISFLLNAFPQVELDPLTTSVDVPFYKENQSVMICLNGVFRDKNGQMFWMGFVFLLRAEGLLKEWKIANQLISVTPASQQQIKEAFVKDVKKIEVMGEPDRDEILSQFKELTSLKSSRCNQFLNDTDWVLENALQSFVDQYKGNQIPDEDFILT